MVTSSLTKELKLSSVKKRHHFQQIVLDSNPWWLWPQSHPLQFLHVLLSHMSRQAQIEYSLDGNYMKEQSSSSHVSVLHCPWLSCPLALPGPSVSIPGLYPALIGLFLKKWPAFITFESLVTNWCVKLRITLNASPECSDSELVTWENPVSDNIRALKS